MGLLDRILDACRGTVEEQATNEQVSTVPEQEPQQTPEQPLFEYTVEVKLLFWGNCQHREVVTIQGNNEEKARLAAYYRVLDRHISAVYGEATVLSCRKLGDGADV